MKKSLLVVLMLAVAGLFIVTNSAMAQDAAPAADVPAGTLEATDGGAMPPVAQKDSSGSFISVVIGGGALGIILWLSLFGAGGLSVYFVVDCFITVKEKRIMPETLVNSVTEAMNEGDLLKAMEQCENEPGAMANILIAGFSHVEEGYEVIQESVAMAADIETERLMQKLTWLSVVGNIAPMLGLLGTVQGMIAAFSSLGEGAPDVGVLAMNISQALYTTAGGLTIAVPCVTFYYVFRNTANKIILRMEAMTMELIKDLRNVEVVDE